MAAGKVLIVDDDEEMCEELQEVLVNEGYSVDIVFEGTKAQKAFDGKDYDAIILDLKLSGISGYELLKSFKTDRPHIKIVILTGNPVGVRFLNEGEAAPFGEGEDAPFFEEDAARRMLSLADGVLNKPCDVEKLLSLLERLNIAEQT